MVEYEIEEDDVADEETLRANVETYLINHYDLDLKVSWIEVPSP